MKWLAGLSPKGKARLAGVFELLEGTFSAGGQVVILGSLVVTGDAAVTAHNILANEGLFRFGFLISVAGVFCHLVWPFLMYQLLRPLNHTIAGLGLLVAVICAGLQGLTAFTYLAPLVVLKGTVGGLSVDEQQGLAMVLLKLNSAAFQLDLVFFGVWCVLTGYLFWRSTFFPRVIGLLLIADGIGWTLYIWPPLATSLFAVIALASACAELPLQFWLIAFGFDNRRYAEQTGASRTGTAGPEHQLMTTA